MLVNVLDVTPSIIRSNIIISTMFKLAQQHHVNAEALECIYFIAFTPQAFKDDVQCLHAYC